MYDAITEHSLLEGELIFIIIIIINTYSLGVVDSSVVAVVGVGVVPSVGLSVVEDGSGVSFEEEKTFLRGDGKLSYES